MGFGKDVEPKAVFERKKDEVTSNLPEEWEIVASEEGSYRRRRSGTKSA